MLQLRLLLIFVNHSPYAAFSLTWVEVQVLVRVMYVILAAGYRHKPVPPSTSYQWGVGEMRQQVEVTQPQWWRATTVSTFSCLMLSCQLTCRWRQKDWCTGSVVPEEDPWYMLVPPHFQSRSEAYGGTASPHGYHTEKKTRVVWPPGQNGRDSWCQEDSDWCPSEWLE